MSEILELSDICSEQNSDPEDQRQRIIALLETGVDIYAADKNGVTALHHAVRFRSPAAVQTLIERGANVNQACRHSGCTPLHRAVTTTGAPGTANKQAEARQIVVLLLAAGADRKLRNRQGKTPGDYARDDKIRELLSAHSSSLSVRTDRAQRPPADE